MIRECTLEDISDGRIYELNDMVKADTGNCKGCNKCCTGMGNSIVLDPYDIWLLKNALQKSFQELINEGRIELNMADGLILPNLAMGDKDRCTFLNEEGRCSIHKNRPGICRLFPLGRVYDGESFKYFLQKGECVRENRAKVKVKKWIDVNCIEENQQFIKEWHYFIRKIGDKVIELKRAGKGENVNDIAMFVLNSFYISDINVEEIETENRKSDNEVYQSLIQRIEKANKIIETTFV